MKTLASPAMPEQETLGIVYVMGITQFVFLSLGLMVLTILVKVSVVSEHVTPLAQFLVTHGLWIAMVPLTWMFLASLLLRFGARGSRLTTATGVLLAVLLGAIFTIAILHPTN